MVQFYVRGKLHNWLLTLIYGPLVKHESKESKIFLQYSIATGVYKNTGTVFN